jgi:ABC-type transport system involved in cytochrome c biogenesis permease subunit
MYSLFWARIALTLYLAGLVSSCVLLVLARPAAAPTGLVERLFRSTRIFLVVGFLFHLVSLVEAGMAAHTFPVTQYSEATSMLAFVIAGFFLLVYRLYSPRALSIVIFPLIFLLMLVSIYGRLGMSHVAQTQGPALLRNHWIYLHVILVFLGYAALFVAFAAEVFYLVGERELKGRRPRPSVLRLLPPLETLDRLSYRSLLAGFPLLTAGLLIGGYWATTLWGAAGLRDPKILIGLLTWALYLILLFSRWSAGWRGRRAAYVTILCFCVAVVGWMSNSFSGVHQFWKP